MHLMETDTSVLAIAEVVNVGFARKAKLLGLAAASVMGGNCATPELACPSLLVLFVGPESSEKVPPWNTKRLISLTVGSALLVFHST